jgi:hypothetical protein
MASIRIAASVTGDLGQIFRQIRGALEQDVTIGVTSATNGAVEEIRNEIRRKFPKSRRLPTVITGKTEPSQPLRYDLNAAGRIYGRGGKRSNWPAPLWAMAFGATITPRKGKFLAVPTKNTPREYTRGTPLTPDQVERRFRRALEFVPAGRFGKSAALVMQVTPGGAKRKPVKQVMFWLVEQTVMPSKFDVSGTVRRWADLVPEMIERAQRAREAVEGRAR